MTIEHLATTLEALQKSDVRFLIAGGLAVIAHGHSRVTHDLDLVVALDSGNLHRAITVLTKMDFEPRLPVDAFDFCDVEKRDKWISEKNLQVFSMVSEKLNGFVIDIFAQEPFDFESEWRKRLEKTLPGLLATYPFVTKETLLEMKRSAGRVIDLDDINKLTD